jgi:hypothetical protein
MSQTQLNRFAVISKVIDGHMTITEAAVSLGISERQTIRKTGSYSRRCCLPHSQEYWS